MKAGCASIEDSGHTMSELRHMRKYSRIVAKDIADTIPQNDHSDRRGLSQIDHHLRCRSKMYQYCDQTSCRLSLMSYAYITIAGPRKNLAQMLRRGNIGNDR